MITAKQLAEIIRKDPKTFMEAFNSANQKYKEKLLDEQFENPAPIETKGRVTFGNVKAPISIVQFSDFQCPPCANASASLKTLIEKYKGKVKLVFKHFPLDFHPMAKPASIYFEAIALIDHSMARKFHDIIYKNIQEYKSLKDTISIEKALQNLVKKAGAKLQEAKKNKKSAEKIIQKDITEAKHLKVIGTPSFFINGVQPPPSKKAFEEIIERHLKKL